jgi:hypothetical protein
MAATDIRFRLKTRAAIGDRLQVRFINAIRGHESCPRNTTLLEAFQASFFDQTARTLQFVTIFFLAQWEKSDYRRIARG